MMKKIEPARLMRDGSMWCALIGVDLQVGTGGFGKTPKEAILELEQEMQKQDRDWHGELYDKAYLRRNHDLDDIGLNSLVRLPNGKIGTICYHNLDGIGGVYGKHTFPVTQSGFSDEIPVPEFMLRQFHYDDDAPLMEYFEDFKIIEGEND